MWGNLWNNQQRQKDNRNRQTDKQKQFNENQVKVNQAANNHKGEEQRQETWGVTRHQMKWLQSKQEIQTLPQKYNTGNVSQTHWNTDANKQTTTQEVKTKGLNHDSRLTLLCSHVTNSLETKKLVKCTYLVQENCSLVESAKKFSSRVWHQNLTRVMASGPFTDVFVAAEPVPRPKQVFLCLSLTRPKAGQQWRGEVITSKHRFHDINKRKWNKS